MKALAALAVVLLLFGCTAQNAQQSALEPEPAQVYEERPLPDTANISFVREPLPGADGGPGAPAFDFTNATDPEGRLRVHFFYISTCPACKAIIPVIDGLESGYPDVVFLRYDIASVNGSFGYKAFADQYGLDQNQRLVPQVLVDGTVITDRFNINESLEGIIVAFSDRT
ncbi:MAG: thioredoxin family protein [Candidatus Micrarchaeota archaeon]